MKVRWPNGYTSDLRDEIAQRIARKGGCVIIDAAVTPQPETPSASSVIEAPPKVIPPVRIENAGRRSKVGRRGK